MSRLFQRSLRILIVVVGAIAGWIAGHAGGPVRLELPQVATGMLGAVTGAGLLIVGCLFAISHHGKRNLSRNSDRHFVNMIQSHRRTVARQKAEATTSDGEGPRDDAVRGGMSSALAVES